LKYVRKWSDSFVSGELFDGREILLPLLYLMIPSHANGTQAILVLPTYIAPVSDNVCCGCALSSPHRDWPVVAVEQLAEG